MAFTEHVSSVLIDDNADGWGWHTDASSAPGANRVDLLTVVMHELGHVLGHEDLDHGAHSEDLMSGLLTPGQRRLPDELGHSIQPSLSLSASLASSQRGLSDASSVDSLFA